MASQIMKKRKRSSYSLLTKLGVYQKIKAGTPSSVLESQYGIGKSTISEIRHVTGPKIEAFLKANPRMDLRKTMKGAAFPELERALKLFFDQQRALGKPISGPLLQEKANIFQEKLSLKRKSSLDDEPMAMNVNLGSGFLHKFKKRHGIRKMTCVGEKGSADKGCVQPFIQYFQEITGNYSRDQIYNADETGLCWRSVPTKTLAGPNELKVEGSKIDKERVTLMACANASGNHKLDLVFIHKYANPRALKHIEKSKLPVIYYNQSKSWMTADLFENWFDNHFVPGVREYLKLSGLEYKAILTLDNAPSHTKFLTSKNGGDSNIQCISFPPNTTSIIQPMDQGVLETVKRLYRKKFMRTALNEDNECKPLAEVKKNITIKNAIFWSAEAWSEITPHSICSSWNMILPPSYQFPPDNQDRSDSIDDDDDITSDWIIEGEDNTYEVLNDDEIIEYIQNETIQEEPIQDLIDISNVLPITDAIHLLNDIMPTLESDSGSTREEILVFQGVLSRWTLQLSTTTS